MALTRKHVWMLAGAVAIAAAGGGIAQYQSTPARAEAAAAQPPTVDVAAPPVQNVIDWQTYSGRLEAVDAVEVRPLVGGRIVAVHFKDGELVRKGQPLFTIDTRPFRAELARAEGQLAAAQAQARFADRDLARARSLVSDDFIARRDFESRQHDAETAAADIRVARAAIDAARLNLEYATITAPVSGRISPARVTLGNVVSAGGAAQPLASIVSVSPIYAAFDADEASYLAFLNQARGTGKGNLPVFIGLNGEDGYPHGARIDSVDNHVDTGSGTVRTRVRIDNPDGTLIPGLLARIRIGDGKARAAVLIDEKIVGTDQDRRFVTVVGKDNKVAYRAITLGAQQGSLRVVTSGLSAEDRIIVGGGAVKPGDLVRAHLVGAPRQ